MTMTTINTLSRLLFVLLSTAVSLVRSQTYSCSYSDLIELDNWGSGTVYMEYYSNLAEETITMRITYMDGDDRWVGIGINTDDDHHMTNSWAVIGDAERGVKRYWLSSEERDASGVWPLDDIHGQLKDASFIQEDGQSILEFTMNLVIKDEDDAGTVHHVISPNSHWIWGVGLSGNRWQGIHSDLGFFDGLPIYEGCELDDTESPQTTAPSELGTSDIEYSENKVDGEIVPEFQEEEEEDYYVDSSAASSAASPASQINFGNSSAQSNASSTRSMWVAHGMVLALAWGLLAPLAIGAAYLRKMQFLQKDALWLCLHFYLSVSCVIFTVFGFIFAVLASSMEADETHFQKDTHHKAGLTIFLLVLVQVAAGHFRPSNAPATKLLKDKNNDNDSLPSVEQDNKDLDETMEIDNGEGTEVPRLPSHEDDKPTKIRQYWEYFHRFLGITLLGLAWYNCTTGIVLQSEKYEQDDEKTLTSIFWGVTGTIASMIFFLGYILRVDK
mmetsp:Transcript_17031/g.27662  ORF Transcript_17031/g.27662 Transcript_17031/m.27662 type:complete len:499 (+) Transcript_17031:131-1627(+)